MKQSAAKTLGVAALGAAFAAAGAGAANAAPAVPDVTSGLDTVTHALPADGLAKTLPGAGQVLGQGQGAVGRTLEAAEPAVQHALPGGQGATGPLGGLLGGLPVQGLPTHGLPVNGIPLG
ncbi:MULTISPECIES: hypothetical protein [Streptomyces]|jgi:hypothetical protein|uniref:Secreted protein n=3 Tax=Streptomyces griseoaurantiacus TaxID=68213 RepID=F3NCS1_9ACTN|nr:MULTISPECIES: hypothetical protein [Streptomyces]EGG48768.1 secreted protein [Streptomyces griseoaurantiacus M045]MBA5219977.1 ATP-binding protein [Streptomyces griseoaurantiacus]MCF0086164.1 hypothetical protein [Streptomyces sp. MH192]MCF0102847.1 hypothetical protein [Streptomyces sp. MH191]MDX3091569.1 ATP-binding protein [Streptomyces sp. ME12-02E]